MYFKVVENSILHLIAHIGVKDNLKQMMLVGNINGVIKTFEHIFTVYTSIVKHYKHQKL